MLTRNPTPHVTGGHERRALPPPPPSPPPAPRRRANGGARPRPGVAPAPQVVGTNTRALERLRRRITVLYGVIAAVGLVALATLVLVADSRTRDASLDAELRGLAIAAGRLVVIRDDGLVTSGLIDDLVFSEFDAVQVVVPGKDGEPPVTNQPKGQIDRQDLARAAWMDPTERGSAVAEVTVDGRPARAVAMPFYSDDNGGVAGAVVVARIVPESVQAGRRQLVLVVVISATGLALALLVTGWIYAGRQVRPLGGALDKQEAFLSLAAHELRTPIGRARAVAESARLIVVGSRGRPISRPELMNELDRMLTITQDASNNVDDLLLIGRIDADRLGHRFAPVRLDEILGPFEDIIPGTIVHTPGPVTVYGDDVLLRHLVQNLVGNARRHGRADWRTMLSVIDVSLEVRPGPGGDEVVLTVADDGPGFAAGIIDTVFERFVHGGKGTGLGLWIVRWITDLHGGTVSVGNRLFGGAEVKVVLPVIEDVVPARPAVSVDRVGR